MQQSSAAATLRIVRPVETDSGCINIGNFTRAFGNAC
jgi:hypothetical protein